MKVENITATAVITRSSTPMRPIAFSNPRSISPPPKKSVKKKPAAIMAVFTKSVATRPRYRPKMNSDRRIGFAMIE